MHSKLWHCVSICSSNSTMTAQAPYQISQNTLNTTGHHLGGPSFMNNSKTQTIQSMMWMMRDPKHTKPKHMHIKFEAADCRSCVQVNDVAQLHVKPQHNSMCACLHKLYIQTYIIMFLMPQTSSLVPDGVSASEWQKINELLIKVELGH